MIIAVLKIRLYASWVHSLKEKRMIVKSLLARIRNQFHVSAAEVEEQDTHQIIVIGIASIAAYDTQAESIMEEIIQYIEQNTDAEVMNIEKEIR